MMFALLILLFFEVNEIRGTKPWSHLPHAWGRMMIASTVQVETVDLTPPCPSVPNIVYSPASEPPKNGNKPKEIKQPLTWQVGTVSSPTTGEPIKLMLKISNHTGGVIKTKFLREGGILASGDLEVIGKSMEDEWSEMIKNPSGYLEINSSMDYLVIETDKLPPGYREPLLSGDMTAYFMMRVVDAQSNKPLLEFCAHMYKNGQVGGCGRHNFP
jgi:hypothetical protein